ncbi:MAG: SCO family protein [Fibrobacterales bacterium]
MLEKSSLFKIVWFLVVISVMVVSAFGEGAQNATVEKLKIGIDDTFLSKHIDLGIQLNDETGKPISLKEAGHGKPIVLALVFYNCSSICSPFLNAIVDVVHNSPAHLQPGEDYTIVAVSFDTLDTWEIAKAKKESYMKMLGEQKVIPDEGFRFLTGSPESIKKLTESVGFYYNMGEDGQYQHTTALIVISPEGTISRYLKGLRFLPLDLLMAVNDASNNKWGPTINRIIKFCYAKDPAGRGYYFDFLKVFGILIILTIGITITSLTIIIKRKQNIKGKS